MNSDLPCLGSNYITYHAPFPHTKAAYSFNEQSMLY